MKRLWLLLLFFSLPAYAGYTTIVVTKITTDTTGAPMVMTGYPVYCAKLGDPLPTIPNAVITETTGTTDPTIPINSVVNPILKQKWHCTASAKSGTVEGAKDPIGTDFAADGLGGYFDIPPPAPATPGIRLGF